MNIESLIANLLETLIDPVLNLTGKEMNLVCNADYENNTLYIILRAGFPSSFLEAQYKNLFYTALKTHIPDHSLEVTIEQHIRPHRTQFPGKGLRGVKNTIAVASGKGGVGKSTVTTNLAASLALAGAKVGILDADIYGPSIPMMLGEAQQVQMQGENYLPIKAWDIQAMSIGYLTKGDPSLIWRGPMLAKSLIQMLDITLWDDLDYLFIDLPPGTGDIQLTLVQKIPLTTAIIVTTPQNVATLDAHKAITMFAKTGIDVLGVVESMSTHLCSQCGYEESIFGAGGAEALCARHHTKLLGQLPLNTSIRQQGDEGAPIATLTSHPLAQTFKEIALRSAVALANKPINYADVFSNIRVE